MDDDWSYVKTAQALAQTGKIAYNGWGSPMLGWQLYIADFFIKIFGFSFTAVRLSTFLVAVVVAFLLQRTFLRTGINQWNATVATFVFVLSPIYFPSAVTFMSDVPGIFCLLLCFYMCLRALQAQSERAAIAWISLAALLNAVGGTARQTAWLGLLVMVPSTLWLLRRNQRVVMAGGLSCVAGVGIVFAASHWFAKQPFSNPIPMMPSKIDLHALRSIGAIGILGTGKLSLLLLPVLLMFVAPLRTWSRRRVAIFLIGSISLALFAMVLSVTNKLGSFTAPFVGDNLMSLFLGYLNGVLDFDALLH
ncbi:MAG: glycosyltransferase family 39 protein, partial [Terracidiphilus sp.]